MKVPGKKFVGTLGFSLTMLSAVLVVGVMSGVPFAASAAAVDGFHTQIDHVQGDNFSMQMTFGGIDECQSLVLNEIETAHISGFAMYRKVDLPGGNVSLEMKIPSDANVTMEELELTIMALESDWLNATDAALYENYSPVMAMGRQDEFHADIGEVEIVNATGRVYAMSSGSMQMPLAWPEFDVGVNEADPDDMPLTRCPADIERRNANLTRNATTAVGAPQNGSE